jgi:hypothetical protein
MLSWTANQFLAHPFTDCIRIFFSDIIVNFYRARIERRSSPDSRSCRAREQEAQRNTR